MSRDEVIRRVANELDNMGISKNVRRVQKVPSSVQVDVLVAGERFTLSLRSGIRSDQLEAELKRLRAQYEHKSNPHQTDLVRAVEEAR